MTRRHDPIPIDPAHRDRFVAHLGEDRVAWIEAGGGQACGRCCGSGIAVYSSTATWHGGVGGQALTSDVCCLCWGSGVHGLPWPSHGRGR